MMFQHLTLGDKSLRVLYLDNCKQLLETLKAEFSSKLCKRSINY